MAEAVKKKKRRRRREWHSRDFEAILALPDRLAAFLRLMLHLDKATWDFCLDKLRQEQEAQAEWRALPGNAEKTRRCVIAYREWSKSKGPGKGWRRFAAPCEELKIVQRAILQRFLATIPVHFARHGNQTGASIRTNAAAHIGARAVFSVDLIHAFPTVTRARVRANLRKPFAFALRQFAGVIFSQAPVELRNRVGQAKDDDARSHVIAEMLQHDVDAMVEALVDLMMLRDRLPQGPPTSPRILDIVCMQMDKAIWALAHEGSSTFQRFRFTAWADDLTMSSDDEIPEELRTAILEAIRANGFVPHTRADKTKYFSPETGEVAVVTGLVITRDGRLTMAPRKLNQLRARLHHSLVLPEWDDEVLGLVAGTLGFVRQVYPEKLPSKLRTSVAQAEARIAAMRAGRAYAALAVPLPPDIEPEVVQTVESPEAPPTVSAAGGNGKKPKAKARKAKTKKGTPKASTKGPTRSRKKGATDAAAPSPVVT
ncbi:MAG: hypothetical protein Q7S02_06210 [bacterium]|nr:hypothetical protein [bacterium]